MDIGTAIVIGFAIFGGIALVGLLIMRNTINKIRGG